MGSDTLDRFGPLALGALSGLLYALSIPKAGLFYLAWIALVPLLWTLSFSWNRKQLLTAGLTVSIRTLDWANSGTKVNIFTISTEHFR